MMRSIVDSTPESMTAILPHPTIVAIPFRKRIRPMIEIVSAQTGEALEHVITLSYEYVTWMVAEIRNQYPELDINEFTSEHDYDDIRKKFPGEHVPPDGCLLIALNGEEVCGCVALGRLTESIGEMRTLFVRPACRGTGVGKKLVETAL